VHISVQFARPFAVCALLWAAAGCGVRSGSQDARDENHPLMRHARALRQAQDMDGAIAAYQAALEKRPGLARAHLELGILYDQPREDYLRAIYHYQRYLEMRPNTEKRELIEELIRSARLSFAASLPDPPNEAIRKIALLEKENRLLREQLNAGATPAPAPAAPGNVAPPSLPAATPAAAPESPRSAPSAAVRTYEVKPGDTLMNIAGRVYGNPHNWQRILDANKNILPNPGALRTGMTLVIPP